MNPNTLISQRIAVRWEDLIDLHPQSWGKGKL